MLFTIQPDGAVPIYEQIVAQVIYGVAAGDLGVGTFIPSVRELAEPLLVHPNTVPRGAICALLGDNGAGKTTTIRMLTGLLPPDSGTATILGQDCWSAAAALRRKVAYVPERPRFYDWMTVNEIGWFTAGFHGGHYLARFREWTDKFLLDGRARLGTLSKGQYAKVGLALALAADPEVLILDEPTSGL